MLCAGGEGEDLREDLFASAGRQEACGMWSLLRRCHANPFRKGEKTLTPGYSGGGRSEVMGR